MSAVPPAPSAAFGLSVAGASDRSLFERYAAGDVRARDLIAERYVPLARRLAGRYRFTSESVEDLEQTACVGLLKAIDRYQEGAGKFVNFAISNIKGELKRHFRDKAWALHIPRSVQEHYLLVNNATEALTARLGRSPKPREIAEKTGLTIEEVLEGLEAGAAYSLPTLDGPVHESADSDRTLGDSLGTIEPGFGTVELAAAGAPAFRALPRRQQQILYLRFVDDLTQSEIATRVGCSQMHVSRLLRRALETLTEHVEAG